MEWINVKDKLPEIKQKVLFVVKTENHLAYLNGQIMAGIFDGLEYHNVAMFSCPGLGVEGTHWMSLPEPPK